MKTQKTLCFKDQFLNNRKMSKNTKHKNYKSYLKLLTEQEKLEVIRRNLGYRELEQPRHHGYEAYLVLRDDIANRDDAHLSTFN
jgi:hypothetical protein